MYSFSSLNIDLFDYFCFISTSYEALFFLYVLKGKLNIMYLNICNLKQYIPRLLIFTWITFLHWNWHPNPYLSPMLHSFYNNKFWKKWRLQLFIVMSMNMSKMIILNFQFSVVVTTYVIIIAFIIILNITTIGSFHIIKLRSHEIFLFEIDPYLCLSSIFLIRFLL